MKMRRVLVVDDEHKLTENLEAIFRLNGYEVTTANTVAGALQQITSKKFDILVSDLNIGEPGDGFTVVSALRRTQPDAIALILTGFPAFDAALQAIRNQVDDFLVKPSGPDELLKTIQRLTAERRRHQAMAPRPLYEIVRHSCEEIVQAWMVKMSAYVHEIGRAEIHGEQLLDHLPDVIEELCVRVEKRSQQTSSDGVRRAMLHGELRRKQGVTPLFILQESTYVREEVLAAIHRRLLSVNLSSLFTDLSLMSDSLDDQLKLAMEAYLG